MRSMWLLLALLAWVPAQVRADTQRTELLVSAYVAPVARVDAADAPGTFLVTAADVTAGYKDVSARYRVSSNTAHGYLLQFSGRAGLTRAIEVRGLGAPVDLGVFGADVAQLNAPRRAELNLQYRLHLASDVRPGEYPLPVSVAATPL